MKINSLLKGFEVELFTGNYEGEHIGIANKVATDLEDFVTEPDHRNLEFITRPTSDYENVKSYLLTPRQKLRKWLSKQDLTIVPGSTLSLGDSTKFERSNPSNVYHDVIERTYGTRVVTTSVHINLGITDLAKLFAAVRLIRCEAALFLSLSASSPFLDGKITGFHSKRWIQFPRTPDYVPIFIDHSHYISWIESQLESKIMRNERHLWTSVRPNGHNRPYELNRLELRICDLVTDVNLLIAITALLELRILNLFGNTKDNDPIEKSTLSFDDLSKLCDLNEELAAKNSLESELMHWQDGRKIKCKHWLQNIIDEVRPLASQMGFSELLLPLENIINNGNQAMQWLAMIDKGESVESVIKQSIVRMEHDDIESCKDSLSN